MTEPRRSFSDEAAWGDAMGTAFVLVVVAILVGIWLAGEVWRG